MKAGDDFPGPGTNLVTLQLPPSNSRKLSKHARQARPGLKNAPCAKDVDPSRDVLTSGHIDGYATYNHGEPRDDRAPKEMGLDAHRM